MIRRYLPFLFLLLCAALLATGCGSDDSSSGDDDGGDPKPAKELPDGTIAVELGEFFVKPSSDSVKAGEVTFQVENTGSASHEFIIYRTDEATDALEQDGGVAKLDESKVIEQTEDISSGDGDEVTVTLEAGRYLLLCNLPGHYQSGQVVEFTVT